MIARSIDSSNSIKDNQLHIYNIMEKMNLSKTVLDMRFMKKTKIEMQKVNWKNKDHIECGI